MVPSSAICAPGGPFGPPAPLSGEALRGGSYVDNQWVQIDHIPFQHMDSRAPESLALDISLANPAVLHALPCVHDDIPKGSPDSWMLERTRGLQPDTTNIKMDTSFLFCVALPSEVLALKKLPLRPAGPFAKLGFQDGRIWRCQPQGRETRHQQFLSSQVC